MAGAKTTVKQVRAALDQADNAYHTAKITMLKDIKIIIEEAQKKGAGQKARVRKASKTGKPKSFRQLWQVLVRPRAITLGRLASGSGEIDGATCELLDKAFRAVKQGQWMRARRLTQDAEQRTAKMQQLLLPATVVEKPRQLQPVFELKSHKNQ